MEGQYLIDPLNKTHYCSNADHLLTIANQLLLINILVGVDQMGLVRLKLTLC